MCTFAPAKRGVAQLVAFLVWDQAVAGSSPVTSTSSITPADFYESAVFFIFRNAEKLKTLDASQIFNKYKSLKLDTMTKKIVLGAAMALLSLASCYNGGNKAETANKSMSFDEVMTSRRSVRDADKLRELFAIPGNETVMAVIALGYRAEEPTRPERKSLDDMVKFY